MRFTEIIPDTAIQRDVWIAPVALACWRPTEDGTEITLMNGHLLLVAQSPGAVEELWKTTVYEMAAGAGMASARQLRSEFGDG